MAEYLIRECDAHGITFTNDAATARNARAVASWCMYENEHMPQEHARGHVLDGNDCYVCCTDMRVADDGEETRPEHWQ
jgi:hypothetical protein